MEAINLICFNCKHLRPIKGGCDAFPEGIPDEITSGFNLHTKSLPEQKNKVVFEKTNDVMVPSQPLRYGKVIKK